MMKRTVTAATALLAFSLLSACDSGRMEVGPTENLPVNIDAASAERANIELDMGAGEMRVTGGSGKLMEGNLEYNMERIKPVVTTTHNGLSAAVVVRQPAGTNTLGKIHNVWDLQLTGTVLLDVAVSCGAGQARLDLGDVRLRDLSVHMGAGEVDLDLTGKPHDDYAVTINGGVGQATVKLPHGVGIWADAHGGLGSIKVEGLEKKGDHWENSLYETSKVKVKIEVNGGIGEIRLIA